MERVAAGALAGTQFVCALTKGARAAEPSRFSSSDSDFDDEEPRKFYVHIKPAPARPATCSSEAAAAQLRATAGSLILPPGPGVSGGLVGEPVCWGVHGCWASIGERVGGASAVGGVAVGGTSGQAGFC